MITNRKTGRKIAFSRKGGVYVLEVMVAPPPGKAATRPLAALGQTELPATAGEQGQAASAPGKPGCASCPGFGRQGTVA